MILWAVIALAAAILIETCEHVAFKKASNLLGILLFCLYLLAWLFALSILPLSIACPFMGLTYITIAIASRIYLKEKITLQRWIGILIIVVGVAMIAGAIS